MPTGALAPPHHTDSGDGSGGGDESDSDNNTIMWVLLVLIFLRRPCFHSLWEALSDAEFCLESF